MSEPFVPQDELKLRPPERPLETRQFLLRENHKGLRRKLDVPGLRMLAHAQPLFLEQLGLQMMLAGAVRWIVKAKIQRDAERSFAGADEPAGKNIRSRGNAGSGFEEIDVVSANAEIFRRACNWLMSAQSAIPIEGFDCIR